MTFQALSLCVVWLCLLAGPALAEPVQAPGRPAADWQATARDLADRQDFANALRLIDRRLEEAPEDLEARGWRARILGWMGRWTESEVEYRRLLVRAPNDVDILTGLGRTLRALGRLTEARELFGTALKVDPLSAEARQGLASVREPGRHLLTVNADTDRYNFTSLGSHAVGGVLRST